MENDDCCDKVGTRPARSDDRRRRFAPQPALQPAPHLFSRRGYRRRCVFTQGRPVAGLGVRLGLAAGIAASRCRSCSTSRRTRMAWRIRNPSSTTPRPVRAPRSTSRCLLANAASSCAGTAYEFVPRRTLCSNSPCTDSVCTYNSCPIYMVNLEAALVVLAEEVAVRVGLLRRPAEEHGEHEAAHAEQRVALAHVLDAQS